MSAFRIVVADSNVLINLMSVSRLALLSKIPGHEFVVPEHVYKEITNPTQRAVLEAAVRDGELKIESITEIDALATFTELIVHIGKGEAACLAIATKRGWSIASDEKRRFRREALARIGKDRILGTADVFVLAVKAGLLTVEQADADKLSLEDFKFVMPFGSFREVLT